MNKTISDRIIYTVSHIPLFIIPILLLFSIAFAFLIDKSFTNKFKPQERLFNNKAHWIKPVISGDRAYYRRDFVLSEKALQGWLLVSAVDTYKIYINGKSLDSEEYLGGKPVGTYDIHHLLKPGNNTISATVGSSSTNITAQIIMQLDLLTASGKHQLFTDQSWKTRSYQPFKQQAKDKSNLYWYEQDYNINYWDNAVIASDFKSLLDLLPDMSHKILNSLKSSYWFWHKEKISPYITVERVVNIIDKDISEVRMGVAVGGYYKININGYQVTNNNSRTSQVVLHNITDYINNGENNIIIELYCSDMPYKSALFGSILYADGEVQTFSSDAGWHIQKPGDDKQLVFHQPDLTTPQFVSGRLEESADFYVDKYIKITTQTLLIFIGVVIIGCLVTNSEATEKSIQSCWRRFLFPYTITAFLMILLLFITLDPAFLLSPVTLRLILIAGVLITLFFSVINGKYPNSLIKGIRS